MTMTIISDLRARHPAADFRLRVIQAAGDRDKRSPLADLSTGGSSFAKELEHALLTGEVDLAVHSLKDLPTQLPAGLTVAAVPERGDARDALCGSTVDALPQGARVGTSSPRRVAQLLRVRPDLDVVPIRGNVAPRLSRFRAKGFDAIVLAAAGVERLEMQAAIDEYLPLDSFIPAPGQGAVAVEVRSDDERLVALVGALDHTAAHAATDAERGVLKELAGGCSLPLGAHATCIDGHVRLRAHLSASSHGPHFDDEVAGPAADAEMLGRQLGAKLRAASEAPTASPGQR